MLEEHTDVEMLEEHTDVEMLEEHTDVEMLEEHTDVEMFACLDRKVEHLNHILLYNHIFLIFHTYFPIV